MTLEPQIRQLHGPIFGFMLYSARGTLYQMVLTVSQILTYASMKPADHTYIDCIWKLRNNFSKSMNQARFKNYLAARENYLAQNSVTK